MSVPRINKCCFCINLHNGALIISIISAFWVVLELFLLGMVVTLKPIDISGNKYIIYIAYMIVNCLRLLFAIMMIVGLIMKRAAFTLPWSILTGIMAFGFLVICVLGFTFILQGDQTNLIKEIMLLTYYLVKSLIWCYFIVVVHSRHKEIMDSDIDHHVEGRRFLSKPPSFNDLNLKDLKRRGNIW